MLTVEEAITKLTGAIEPLVASEAVPIAESLGRALAVDVEALVNVPPADNSAMDGYAFCYAAAAAQGFELPLSQRIVAGSAPRPRPTAAAFALLALISLLLAAAAGP